MGGKTKKEKQKTRQQTTFSPLPLGKPAFFGKQEELFGRVGDVLGKRLKDPLTSPGFAAGRDFLSRRTEILKRGVRGAPNIFAGLRFGAERDVEATETRALSDLIGQIRQGAIQNALAFATRPIQRGAVGATSTEGETTISQPGVTAGEQFANIGLGTLESFGQSFGRSLGGGLGGGLSGGMFETPAGQKGAIAGASGGFR